MARPLAKSPLLLLALGFWILGGATALAKGDDPNALYKQFKKLFEQGKYQEAIPIAERLLEVTKRAMGPEHPETAAVMEKMCYVGCYQPSPNAPDLAYGELPGWIDGSHYANVRYTPNGKDANSDIAAEPYLVLGPTSANQLLSDLTSARGLGCTDFGFASAHGSVMHALFADGSVHPVSTNIEGVTKDGNRANVDNCVLFRLGARDDGLQLSENDY